jgi:hypothetical protein
LNESHPAALGEPISTKCGFTFSLAQTGFLSQSLLQCLFSSSPRHHPTQSLCLHPLHTLRVARRPTFPPDWSTTHRWGRMVSVWTVDHRWARAQQQAWTPSPLNLRCWFAILYCHLIIETSRLVLFCCFAPGCFRSFYCERSGKSFLLI